MNLAWNDRLIESKSVDKSLFEALYQYFQPRLKYFANQYLHDSDDAQSIVQDVFTELWDKRNSLSEDTNIQAWLFTVTKNKALKMISKIKSRQNYDNYIRIRQLDIDYKALDDFETSNFLFDELQSKVQSALEKLPASCRMIFEMSRFQDKKNKEIAEELGLSIKTVEAQISKALKLMRNYLKDYLPLFSILML
ncbi:MAG TPA: RNA polymerase sigma-70 factor [Bacteroidales bacterium]